MEEYKVNQLKKMLARETAKDEIHYGAHLSHWAGDSKDVQIDAGGLRVLIKYYSTHKFDLGNKDEKNN